MCRRLSSVKPVIIDESDDDLGVFPRARSLGYTGVSSKCCKGLYKSILNAARCARWNAEAGAPRYFMTGEDLTTQAGLAVQQDLALVNLTRHPRTSSATDTTMSTAWRACPGRASQVPGRASRPL